MYLPGWIGPDHGARAFAAALRVLRETGNAGGLEPWVPVGIGMHFGAAYVGVALLLRIVEPSDLRALRGLISLPRAAAPDLARSVAATAQEKVA